MSEILGNQERRTLANTTMEIRARRKFVGLIRSLSPENQDFLSDITSILTEPDIYAQSKADLDWVGGLHSTLTKRKLDEKQIKIVFDYFNLPFKNIK